MKCCGVYNVMRDLAGKEPIGMSCICAVVLGIALAVLALLVGSPTGALATSHDPCQLSHRCCVVTPDGFVQFGATFDAGDSPSSSFRCAAIAMYYF
jgi:hypothetical protein